MLDGFDLWVPQKAATYEDGIPQWEILGNDCQFVQFPLRAGRQITCFSGAMAYMSSDVKMSVKLAGLKKTFGRLAGGGSIFQTTYTNEGQGDGYISMTPDYPGILVPIDFSTSGKIVALRDSFLCSTITPSGEETDIGVGFNPGDNVIASCCSGFDFIVQTIHGPGTIAFLMAMGTVITKTLESGESILIDGDSLLCFEEGVQLEIEAVGNIATMCCAGEGLFNTKMTGPGKIYLQSMGIDKMRKLFPPTVVKSNNTGEGDGE